MKAYTDILQSKKLAKILPIESADMCWILVCYGDEAGSRHEPSLATYKTGSHFRDRIYPKDHTIPCWSLAALLNYLREIDFFSEIEADEHGVTMSISYYDDEEGEPLNPLHDIRVKAESFIDACYEMLEKLHEQKLL